MASRISIFYLGAILVLSSCQFEFTDADKEFMKAYEVAQTIVFQNESGTTDSIIITEVKYYHNGLNEGIGGIHDIPLYVVKYMPIPNQGFKEIDIKGYKKIDKGANLVYAYKYEPDGPLLVDVNFKGLHATLSDTSQLLNNLELGNYYRLSHSCLGCKGRNDNDATHLYWEPNVGIIRYELKNGEVWNKALN